MGGHVTVDGNAACAGVGGSRAIALRTKRLEAVRWSVGG